ncbi:hypothetical protein TNCT_58171 [Trichonephila clavata]|uniref:Uncharacterized protein n=1 Tax=Trichonephila clavata TaxID=2740835 RepID=A0A8X6FG84_TRICU|nr:hypothetical protein TNCT_58171 [Trichonephila clavata]
MNVVKITSVLLLWIAFRSVRAALIRGSCLTGNLQCADRRNCIFSFGMCDGNRDCRDGSDEIGCVSCSHGQFRCADRKQCIDSSLICNGEKDCSDGLDEISCGTAVADPPPTLAPTSEDWTVGNKVLNVPGVASARARLISWFKERRKSRSTVDKWSSQLPRVAVALHLANESTFSSENTIGQEISYELTIQLLHRHSKQESCLL